MRFKAIILPEFGQSCVQSYRPTGPGKTVARGCGPPAQHLHS